MIRLRKGPNTYTYSGRFVYLVVANTAAGRANVYSVFVLNVDDPVTIGRELDLKVVRRLISYYEEVASPAWFGERSDVLKCLGMVSGRSSKKKRRNASPKELPVG